MTLRKALIVFMIAAMAIWGFGCSSSSSSPDDNGGNPPTPPVAEKTVSGMAAAGAPIVGTVNIRGANGKTSSSAIRADGSYTVNVEALKAPFVIYAAGRANGKTVSLYSTVEAPGKANITPATHMVMSMALGEDPAAFFEKDPNAPVPEKEELAAAKEKVQEILSIVFKDAGIENFDVMNGSFVADGEGFDKVLDVVEMKSQGKTVAIVDRASGDKVYTKNLKTGNETPIQPDEIAQKVKKGTTIKDAITKIAKKVETVFATRPSLETLEAELKPYMAQNFLDNGMPLQEALETWAMDKTQGPETGIQIPNVALHRKMQTLSLSDFTVDELKAGEAAGYWCVMRIVAGNLRQDVVTAFVKENKEWKWAGDRSPVRDGGKVQAEGRLFVDADGKATIKTGLQLQIRDEGNAAKDNFGIDGFQVFNPSLPPHGDGEDNSYVYMQKTPGEDEDVRYRIVDATWPDPNMRDEKVPADAVDNDRFLIVDGGLDLARLTDSEFIMVGGNDTGATHAWISLLPAKPVAPEVLTKNPENWFPQIQTVNGHPLQDADFQEILKENPENFTFTWKKHATMAAEWAAIAFISQDSYEEREKENPQWGQAGAIDWTTYTMPVDQFQTEKAHEGALKVQFETENDSEFGTEIRFNTGIEPMAPPEFAVQIHGNDKGDEWVDMELDLPNELVADGLLAEITIFNPAGEEIYTLSDAGETDSDDEFTYYYFDSSDVNSFADGIYRAEIALTDGTKITVQDSYQFVPKFFPPTPEEMTPKGEIDKDTRTLTWKTKSYDGFDHLYYRVHIYEQQGNGSLRKIHKSKRMEDAQSYPVPEDLIYEEQKAYFWLVEVMDSDVWEEVNRSVKGPKVGFGLVWPELTVQIFKKNGEEEGIIEIELPTDLVASENVSDIDVFNTTGESICSLEEMDVEKEDDVTCYSYKAEKASLLITGTYTATLLTKEDTKFSLSDAYTQVGAFEAPSADPSGMKPQGDTKEEEVRNFSWPAVTHEGIDSFAYRVRLYKGDKLIYKSDRISQTQLTLPDEISIDPETTYLWQVEVSDNTKWKDINRRVRGDKVDFQLK